MKKTIYPFMFFLLLGEMLHSQASPGTVVSPLPGTVVPNEQLFIVFRKNSRHQWEDYQVTVFLDQLNISTLAKTNGDLLTLLATHRMKPGEHSITIRFVNKTSLEPLVAKWLFQVEGRASPLPADGQNPTSAFVLRSDLRLQSRLTNLSGPGQYLRQEPSNLHTLNFQGSAAYKKLEIPFRVFVTNRGHTSPQWRNTYMVGLKSNWFGLFGGDVFPTYQRQVLNGSKIRGGRAYLKWRNTTFDLTYGAIQRSLEGELRQYDVALGFPPVNLETSTGLYIVPGQYRRDVLAAQVLFNSKRSGTETAFTFLRGTDKASSIEYGGTAGENVVIGFRHKTHTKNKALELDFGVAASMLTRDAADGAATQQEIEDVYDREPPINPSDWESIFVVNASTTPLRLGGLPSVSAFGNMRLNVLRQHLTAQYERVGGSFYTYGMPYLINDRRTLSVGDWVHLWKQRIMLSANYRYYVNNLAEEKPTTQKTGYLQTSLRLRPKPGWPQLVFSYNDFRRKGEDLKLEETTFKRTVLTWTAGVFHAFSIGKTQQSVNASYSRNNRLDKLRADNDFFTNSLSLRLSTDLPFGLQVSAEYQFLLLSNDTSDFNRQNGYGARLRYQTPGKQFNISAGVRQFRTAETFFIPEANRRLFDGRAEYFIASDLSLSLQIGQSEYREELSDNRSYQEFWGQLELRYSLR